MRGGMRRREWLKLVGIAAGASLVGCGSTQPARRKNVIVIGAGLAGMCCAYELMKAGHDVTVLEAQSRIGGRVYTVRAPFTNGLWAEMGAMRIPNIHFLTLAYVHQFGLPLITFDEPSSGTDVRPLYYLNGQRFAAPAAGEPWPLSLTADEHRDGLEMVRGYFEPFVANTDARVSGFPSADVLARYDNKTVAQHLAALGASEDWYKLLVSSSGTYAVRASLLQVLWHEFSAINAGWNQAYTIDGGCDRLTNAFAEALDGVIRVDSPVLHIAHSPDQVTVTYQNGGQAETITGEYLVVAISFPALRNVGLAPEFSAEKMRAIREIEYVPASRTAFQTATRFWRSEVQRGFWVACTDTPVERLWDQSNGQPTDSGLLVSYAHEGARTLARYSREARIGVVRSTIEQVLPEFASQYTGQSADMYWNEDPWTGGISPLFQPGQTGWAYPIMGRREGRVFFAGEHTSAFASWMQGAFQSGRSVATAIHDEP